MPFTVSSNDNGLKYLVKDVNLRRGKNPFT
jgi:hypothetical protein